MNEGRSPRPDLEFGPCAKACALCGNEAGNRTFRALERMLGLGDAFTYQECGGCRALELLDAPADLAPYYPPAYYSYAAAPPDPGIRRQMQAVAMRALLRHRLGRLDPWGALLAGSTGKFAWVRPGLFTPEMPVLDVGCGSGALLHLLKQAGFRDLTGADPFVDRTVRFPGGPVIHKARLEDLEGRYGCIMLNHTFEHVPDPEALLHAAYDRLMPDGTLLLRIPVADCHAWRTYGAHWVQLDAPRHFFLHTEASIRHLAARTAFDVQEVIHDSSEFQFEGSEKYVKGLTLDAPDPSATRGRRKAWRRAARVLNAGREGDTASFYLRPVNRRPQRTSTTR